MLSILGRTHLFNPITKVKLKVQSDKLRPNFALNLSL
jgi:hypothetical protein